MTPLIGAGACCIIALPGTSLVLAYHQFDLNLSFWGWIFLITVLATGLSAGFYAEEKFARQEAEK
jgi:hypothetical protein